MGQENIDVIDYDTTQQNSLQHYLEKKEQTKTTTLHQNNLKLLPGKNTV